MHPDDFVISLMEKDPAIFMRVLQAVKKQRKDYKKPPITASELLVEFQASGMTRLVKVLRPFMDHI